MSTLVCPPADPKKPAATNEKLVTVDQIAIPGQSGRKPGKDQLPGVSSGDKDVRKGVQGPACPNEHGEIVHEMEGSGL